jgi:hypothetical protein
MQEEVDCGAHWVRDGEGAMKRKSRIARMSVLLTVLASVVIVAIINEFYDRNEMDYAWYPAATADDLRAYREAQARRLVELQADKIVASLKAESRRAWRRPSPNGPRPPEPALWFEGGLVIAVSYANSSMMMRGMASEMRGRDSKVRREFTFYWNPSVVTYPSWHPGHPQKVVAPKSGPF